MRPARTGLHPAFRTPRLFTDPREKPVDTFTLILLFPFVLYTLNILLDSSFLLRKKTMISVTRASTVAHARVAFRAVSTWSNVPAGPPDPILGMFLLPLFATVLS